MMEDCTNNLNLSDSGNLNGNHIRWNEAGVAILPSVIHSNVINAVGPVYTGCNLDIARNLCEEDLRALDYDIPDEYLHQCLESDYLLPQHNYFAIDSGKQGILSREINGTAHQINRSCKIGKKSILDEIYVGSLVNDFHNTTEKIHSVVGDKLMVQELLPNNEDYHKRVDIFSEFNTRNEQELFSQSFRIKYVSQKHYPLNKIDNLINEINLSSKTADTFVKHKHITNICYETNDLNANIYEMKTVNRPDKRSRLLKRKRKPRTKLTANQLFFLNKAFAKNHYLTSEMSKLLSKRLDISEMCLKTWFQNQRARYKRMDSDHRESLNCRERSDSFPTSSLSLLKRNMNSQNQRK